MEEAVERLRGDGWPGEGGRRLEGAPQHELDDAAGAVALVAHGQVVEAEPGCLEEALDLAHPAQGQGRARKVERLHRRSRRARVRVCARACCACVLRMRAPRVFAARVRRVHAACMQVLMRVHMQVHMQVHTREHMRACMQVLMHALPAQGPARPRLAGADARSTWLGKG